MGFFRWDGTWSTEHGHELEPEGTTGDVRLRCEAETEPFGPSRVNLDAQPIG
jgi:hypothetical protein